MIDIHYEQENSASSTDMREALAATIEDEMMALETQLSESSYLEQEADLEQPVSVKIESARRFSESSIWSWQRTYFEQAGVAAWRDGTVPHYVTSSSFAASTYAQLILAHLRDLAAQGTTGPVYIVELGAGSGQFSFHCLRHLASAFAQLPINEQLSFVYVMTDFAESNVAFWRNHPSLQPFVEARQLDWALFDAEGSTSLLLECSGIELQPQQARRPMVAIANYLFDSIPQDLFYVEGGQLFEQRVELHSTQPEPNLADASLIDRVLLHYHAEAVKLPFYNDAELDALLTLYTTHFEQTNVLFPHLGIDCIRRLNAIAGKQLLVLSGDKGHIRAAELAFRAAPGLTRHGSFSLSVNYHAIKQFVAATGGTTLHATNPHSSINVCAFMPNKPQPGRELALAFRNRVDDFGPDHQFVLKKSIERNFEQLTADELLCYIRMSGFDPKAFRRAIPFFVRQAGSLSIVQIKAIDAMARQVWENYYPLGEQTDLAFNTGVLLYELDCYATAIQFFEDSLALYGPDAGVECNLAMCCYQLSNYEGCGFHLDRALALQPDHEGSLNMLAQLRETQQPTADGR